MRGMGDVTSANIFEAILSDEEEHIDYLETQQGLLALLGEQHYVAQLVRQPDDDRRRRRPRRTPARARRRARAGIGRQPPVRPQSCRAGR
jgi:hypothetical protein